MKRLRILTVAAAFGCSVPATAEKPSPTISALRSLPGVDHAASPQNHRRSMGLPLVNYAYPDGGSPMPKGIIAGHQIAPGTILGLGIFQTTPKMRGYVGDVPQNMAPRRTRKAAVGLSMKF